MECIDQVVVWSPEGEGSDTLRTNEKGVTTGCRKEGHVVRQGVVGMCEGRVPCGGRRPVARPGRKVPERVASRSTKC